MNRRVRDFYGRPLKIDCEDQETGGAIVSVLEGE